MQVQIQVLNSEEQHQVHERSLRILTQTGLQVNSARARKILADAGAQIDESKQIVHFPIALVEQALSQAPKSFTLGGRRPGWYWPMNTGNCTLVADGEARYVVDAQTAERRLGTDADWLKATQLIDAIDEIGVYWRMVSSTIPNEDLPKKFSYWRNAFTQFSKHIQDSTETPLQSRWLLELLQTIFGGREAVRLLKPLSFLLCPVSPLVIDETYTNAYLELCDWGIPVAAMPMPIMGLTSPARLIATTVVGNCEVLAILCLVQAASPGTPFIYAPALAAAEPRSGRYTGGAVEHALLSLSVIQMARYYGLPVEASTGSTHKYLPGIQAGYERAINWTLPTLAWPDILVGPGTFEGSTMLCFEQLILDVEVFRYCKRLQRGINTRKEQWLEDLISHTGPGGNFFKHPTTLEAVRSGVWYNPTLGDVDSGEAFRKRLSLIEETRERIEQILQARQPLPMDEQVEKELDRLESKAKHVRENQPVQ